MIGRFFLKNVLTVSVAIAITLTSSSAIAKWAEETFNDKDFNSVMSAIGADNAQNSAKIVIDAPKIAENGNVVPITVSTTIDSASQIYVLVKQGKRV